MGLGVSTQSDVVKSGIACCRTAIHELEAAYGGLKQSYTKAGSGGWKDQKYAALGGIVEECCSALTKPIGELQDCVGKLQELLAAIEEYESTNL